MTKKEMQDRINTLEKQNKNLMLIIKGCEKRSKTF